MIRGLAVKSGPALTQEEIEKALRESGDMKPHVDTHKMPRIEVVADLLISKGYAHFATD